MKVSSLIIISLFFILIIFSFTSFASVDDIIDCLLNPELCIIQPPPPARSDLDSVNPNDLEQVNVNDLDQVRK